MTNTIIYNGIEYTPINDAEIRQHGAPAVAYAAIDAYKTNANPDEYGFVDLVELVYNIPKTDPEIYDNPFDLIDWDNPDDIRNDGRSWNVKTNSPWMEA